MRHVWGGRVPLGEGGNRLGIEPKFVSLGVQEMGLQGTGELIRWKIRAVGGLRRRGEGDGW